MAQGLFYFLGFNSDKRGIGSKLQDKMPFADASMHQSAYLEKH